MWWIEPAGVPHRQRFWNLAAFFPLRPIYHPRCWSLANAFDPCRPVVRRLPRPCKGNACSPSLFFETSTRNPQQFQSWLSRPAFRPMSRALLRRSSSPLQGRERCPPIRPAPYVGDGRLDVLGGAATLRRLFPKKPWRANFDRSGEAGGGAPWGRWLATSPPEPGIVSILFTLGVSFRALRPPPRRPWPASGRGSCYLCGDVAPLLAACPLPHFWASEAHSGADWCCGGRPPSCLIAFGLISLAGASQPGQRQTIRCFEWKEHCTAAQTGCDDQHQSPGGVCAKASRPLPGLMR